MRIRKMSRQHINTAARFLQKMVNEMTSFGGLATQEPDRVLGWFRDHIHTHLEMPNHLFLMAEGDSATGEPIGILEASISKRHPVFLPRSSLHIHSIFVLPDQRRSGVARRLMEAAFDWGRKNGCVEADLNVLQRSPAKLLYEQLGFEVFQHEMRRGL
jgi:aminoglycoside 6'-N-acetyltransferase I